MSIAGSDFDVIQWMSITFLKTEKYIYSIFSSKYCQQWYLS